MKFRIDRISSTLLIQPNFPLLQKVIGRFDSGQVTGFATLAETPFLKHLRLLFFGSGDHTDTVLYGPAFSPLLLEIPAMADQIREIADEFLKQVRQLDTTSELSSAADNPISSASIDAPSIERALGA